MHELKIGVEQIFKAFNGASEELAKSVEKLLGDHVAGGLGPQEFIITELSCGKDPDIYIENETAYSILSKLYKGCILVSPDSREIPFDLAMKLRVNLFSKRGTEEIREHIKELRQELEESEGDTSCGDFSEEIKTLDFLLDLTANLDSIKDEDVFDIMVGAAEDAFREIVCRLT